MIGEREYATAAGRSALRADGFGFLLFGVLPLGGLDSADGYAYGLGVGFIGVGIIRALIANRRRPE